jgi:hypothetical protein
MRPYQPSFIPPKKPQDAISESTPKQGLQDFSAQGNGTPRRQQIPKRQDTSLNYFTKNPLRLRSNGSLCGPGSRPASWACAMVSGNCRQPFSATISSRRSARRAGAESWPSLCLVAISWAEAALTKIVVAGSPSSDAAARERRESPRTHQSNAWVSIRTFTRGPAPPRISLSP